MLYGGCCPAYFFDCACHNFSNSIVGKSFVEIFNLYEIVKKSEKPTKKY